MGPPGGLLTGLQEPTLTVLLVLPRHGLAKFKLVASVARESLEVIVSL